MNERFSVSMCVYGKDNPKWFETAVESILNQSIVPSEVVLVVDGPVPDELNEIIKKYELNEIFNIIRLKQNQGHGNARRIGFEACTNDIVALMDADDISVPDRFEQQLNIFKNKEVDIVGGNIGEFIDSTENIIAYRTVPTSDIDIKKCIRTRCPFNQMTVMLKKSAVQNAGGYLDWYCNEDYYLWIRMFQMGCTMCNTGTVLVNARVGKDMYKRRGGIKYFRSEVKLQKYMFDNKIVGVGVYFMNVSKRFVVQVLLPNKIRGWVFKKFARKKV